jgi:hypothetical protein
LDSSAEYAKVQTNVPDHTGHPLCVSAAAAIKVLLTQSSRAAVGAAAAA